MTPMKFDLLLMSVDTNFSDLLDILEERYYTPADPELGHEYVDIAQSRQTPFPGEMERGNVLCWPTFPSSFGRKI